MTEFQIENIFEEDDDILNNEEDKVDKIKTQQKRESGDSDVLKDSKDSKEEED